MNNEEFKVSLKKEVLTVAENILNVEIEDKMTVSYVEYFSKLKSADIEKATFNKILRLGRTAIFSFEIKKRLKDPDNCATRKMRAVFLIFEASDLQTRIFKMKKKSNLMKLALTLFVILMFPLYFLFGSILSLIYEDL